MAKVTKDVERHFAPRKRKVAKRSSKFRFAPFATNLRALLTMVFSPAAHVNSPCSARLVFNKIKSNSHNTTRHAKYAHRSHQIRSEGGFYLPFPYSNTCSLTNVCWPTQGGKPILSTSLYITPRKRVMKPKGKAPQVLCDGYFFFFFFALLDGWIMAQSTSSTRYTPACL